MPTNEPRKVVNLADIQARVSRRGRKTTVTQADINDAQALEVGEGLLIDEFDLDGDEFAKYRDERLMATYNGDENALINAWTSRYRQRVAALAKASGVALSFVVTNDGEGIAARTA